MEQRKRNTFGKFTRSKSADKKSSRSDYFKWLNDGRKLEDSPQVGLRNDHGNYVCEYLDVGAEAELEGDNTSDIPKSWAIGRRIVEWNILAEGMYCCTCKCPLHLSDIVGERLFGLGGLLMVDCKLCHTVTDVHFGKRGPSGSYDINTKASIGMIHAGMGPTHLQNFLAECNLPSITESTLRKKEKELSGQIKNVTIQSCNMAQREEKSLSTNGNIEASFDGGWQKRGSGWNYNSNTGHATFIGKETGKVLSFDLRSKTCKICEFHQNKKETVPEHECHLNWHGSSKSMEADMAVAMAHRLKDDECEINVIHADNDASTTARLEVEFGNIQKKDDQNHVKKGYQQACIIFQRGILQINFSVTDIYKELQKDETKQYILRCFMYAIKGGDNEDDIKIGLQRIVPHIFGSHENCKDADWCSYHQNPEKFMYKSLPNGKPLKSEGLKVELNNLVTKMIGRSNSLNDLGSTQSNESFNQLVSVKAPKSRHYGGSCSLQNRLSAAVLQKNEGYGYLSKINEAANLSPGEFTMAISAVRDQKMEKRKEKKNSKEYKVDRIQKKRNRNTNERKHLVREETTGLGRNSDIIQIAAKSYSNSFNRYVIPRVDIQIEASKITGITYSHGTNKMYVRGQIVEPVSLHKALLDFIHFLKEQNQPIILGHNICNFDIPVIVNKLKEYNLFSTFCKTVKGFIDTMKVARKYIPKHDVENFKQQTLVKQFVGENYLAHNAIEDVDSLKTLYDSKLALLVKSDDVFAISYHNCMDSYSGLLSSKIVSRPVCIQLAKDGISLKHLKLASVRDVNGLKFVLQDHKIPPKSVKCIQDFFQTEE
ncbi:unnamed protein product [Mytilus edulis]|uniref:Exonuclease domain-containing protein n=1 Tax=Mytilus edulis TaxID=6550 RepID=A0A8S3UY84_MYTED|nr:unnamed protein product [Mytilus edulis]